MTAPPQRREHIAQLKQENDLASLRGKARLGDTSFLPGAITLEQIKQQGETGRTQLQGETSRDVANINTSGELERQRLCGKQMKGLEGHRPV